MTISGQQPRSTAGRGARLSSGRPSPGDPFDANAVRPAHRRRPAPAQPRADGPAHPLPQRPRARADGDDGRVLRPAGVGRADHLRGDQRRPEIPRALDRDERPGVVAAYRRGAENAKVAGFDGVEIHGANGYLLDQFLQSGTNKRTDDYGGPIENRARLMLEVTDAAIEVWTPGRVGVHLAPRGNTQGISDADPATTWGYVATELGKRKIAFLAAREARAPGWLGPQLKRQFGGVYIANQSFTKATANEALAAGDADAVLFGVPFIANPDLPRRLREDAPLNEPRRDTFYAQGAAGYTDYARLP
jgi:2,4-dienoyl-CoA reductase-like NADH-dependent reductase (Old Yellow Enzyme family)